jgi:uncharacterized Zn finger protein (UPF0148 family)
MKTCPLCGYKFEKSADVKCASCPVNCGKGTLCCPNCGYKYIEKSSTVELLKKLIKRRNKNAA